MYVLIAISDEEKAWTWEPETIEAEIPGYIGHRMPLIQAVAAALNNARGDAYEDIPQFDKVGQVQVIRRQLYLPWREADLYGASAVAFAGIDVDFGLLQMPTAGQLWYCHQILSLIEPITEDIYSDEVIAYIANCLIEQGVYFCPWSKRVNDKIIALYKNEPHMLALNRNSMMKWRDDKHREEMINEKDENLGNAGKAIQVQLLRMKSASIWKDERNQLSVRQKKELGIQGVQRPSDKPKRINQD